MTENPCYVPIRGDEDDIATAEGVALAALCDLAYLDSWPLARLRAAVLVALAEQQPGVERLYRSNRWVKFGVPHSTPIEGDARMGVAALTDEVPA